MKNFMVLFIALFAATCAVAHEIDESRNHSNHHRDKVIRVGIAVTGANIRLGQPIWSLGEGLGTAAFSFVFGFNPNGTEPLALTSSSPTDTVLATGFDENFLEALGLSAIDFNPSPTNIPFHQVPVIVNPFTGDRAKVGLATDVQGSIPSRSTPKEPITLKQWLKAKGWLEIECDKSHKENSVKIKASGLIPNGVYTIWALFGDDINGDGLEDRMVPSALGGVPNVVIPDSNGNAQFERKLGFCPMDEKHMKLVDITYHSDSNVFGGTVDMFLPSFAGFAVTNTHVAFPIHATPL